MENIHIKSVLIASSLVYIIAIIAFTASYFYPIMEDADLQANYVLSLVIIPAALFGAHIYYRKGHQSNGFALGICMFLVAMVLDSLITVPFFIMPFGGNHITFFTDPGFWLIGLEYVMVVSAYRQLERTIHQFKVND